MTYSSTVLIYVLSIFSFCYSTLSVPIRRSNLSHLSNLSYVYSPNRLSRFLSSTELSCLKPETKLSVPLNATLEFSMWSINPAPDQSCQWRIELLSCQRIPCRISIIFTSFQTEYGVDIIYILNDRNEIIQQLSGNIIVPFTLRIRIQTYVIVQFTTIPMASSNHRKNLAYPIGFNATVFESSLGTCYRDCGDNQLTGGICNYGHCLCNINWIRSGCSVYAPTLQNEVAVQIRDLCIGCSQFALLNVTEWSNIVVELVDIGHPDSDPLLEVWYWNLLWVKARSYYSWYYDLSDVHYRHDVYPPGYYYVRVQNHRSRASQLLDADLTVRITPRSQLACVGNCFGGGICDLSKGICNCSDGHTGEYCRFPSVELQFGESVNASLRIGDWAYYTIKISSEFSNRDLFVSMNSHSPRSWGILLLRKDIAPELDYRYLPTSEDAFIKDYADTKGFNLLQGRQQNILVPRINVTEGVYYIGIFNLWGYTGVDTVSYETLQYELFVDTYGVGTPCPRTDGDFCNGFTCDFNTGKCSCPDGYIGASCGIKSYPLMEQVMQNMTLETGESAYYFTNVSASDLARGKNMKITLLQLSESGNPLLLARKGDIPYSSNYSLFDEHDLNSNFYDERVHTIILDREELTLGVWYFAVINSLESVGQLIYNIHIEYHDQIDCPKEKHTHKMCSAHGQCIKTLGRCDCTIGHTSDDCSADGVFQLADGGTRMTDTTESGNFPPINADDWGYWSFPIGCEGINFGVEIKVDEGSPGAQTGAMPLLAIRRGTLPLQSQNTLDYYDYYSVYKLHQRIEVKECDPECSIRPNIPSPGTVYAESSAEPGIYFVGIYNDRKARGPFQNYTVRYWIEGNCSTSGCSNGFLNSPAGDCQLLCPGMMALNAYSNTPSLVGKPCNGRGECGYNVADAKTKCSCSSNSWGDSCEIVCPGTWYQNGNWITCAGHGICSKGNVVGSVVNPLCECDSLYEGKDCSSQCPGVLMKEGKMVACQGHGKCKRRTLFSTSRNIYCECDKGYAGETCSFACPNLCSDHGKCNIILDSHDVKNPVCTCDIGYLGKTCDMKCPGLLDPVAGPVCNGNGKCVLIQNGTNVGCLCYEEFSEDGNCRSKTSFLSLKGGAISQPFLILLIVVSIFAFICVIAVIWLWRIAGQRKKEIETLLLLGKEEEEEEEDEEKKNSTKMDVISGKETL